MRIGHNPNKDKNLDVSFYEHQVIVPVHIPNFEGYFKDSLTILKYCLESLFKTSHERTFFTIVNNGSCKEVLDYLNDLFEKKSVHEIIHTESIGKMNAILKGLVGHDFPLTTITDADVIFLQNWQKATYAVFNGFPKAGVVTTTPNSKLLKYHTEPLFFSNLFSRSLSFSDVQNPNALIKFSHSIGNTSLFKKIHLEKYLTITSKCGVKAVVGAGHFVATYRGDLFDNLTSTSTEFSLGGKSEEEFLDRPLIKKALWRLSTLENYTLHMGNTLEPWMGNVLDSSRNLKYIDTQTVKLAPSKLKNSGILLIQKLLAKVIFRKPIWIFYLQLKGLKRKEAKEY